MAEAARRAGRVPWLIKALVLAAGAVALAALSLSVFAQRAIPAHLGGGALFGAEDPDTLYRRAGIELIRNRGRLTDGTLGPVVAALRREPLAAEPFVYAGVRALERRDLRRAEELLTEARRRDPRQRLARLGLMAIYLQTRRIEPGTSEIAALLRLVPDAQRLLIPELARLAASPETSAGIVDAIGDRPLMGAVLTHLARNGAEPDLVIQLARRQPLPADGSFAPWQTTLLQLLVERNQYDRAYQLWSRYTGQARRAPGLLYDPQFRRLPGPPPFNWVAEVNAAGAAEFVSPNGIDVDYFGREEGRLVSQLVMAPPGRYRFSIRAEGEANGQGSRLIWIVACRPSNQILLQLPLERITAVPRDLRAEFNVPASGCGAQLVELRGVPAEFPTRQSARFSAAALEPVR